MQRLPTALFGLLALAAPACAARVDPDARMNAYFAIWADNGRVTPAAVGELYGRRVIYYGQAMTPSQVYRDKLAFVRRWPSRRYGVVPGSVNKVCDAADDRCRVKAVLRWERADATGRGAARGVARIVLDLVREDGTLRIVRESGVPLYR